MYCTPLPSSLFPSSLSHFFHPFSNPPRLINLRKERHGKSDFPWGGAGWGAVVVAGEVEMERKEEKRFVLGSRGWVTYLYLLYRE